MANDSFGARAPFKFGGQTYNIARLDALERQGFSLARLPYSIRIMLENVLRREDGKDVTVEQIKAVAGWTPVPPEREISFMPARVLLQDFTGIPVVADLAAMRAAMQRLGGDPKKVNPVQRVELVIDHSVQIDYFGNAAAFGKNAELEFERNQERYAFLRWGQSAFDNFRVVPPDTGIVHQVNLEYLAQVVFVANGQAYPDTVVGADSHTPMVNGLGVVGWGVGGIEAEAAMLGQSIPMLIPQVVGVRVSGELAPGATATDMVLTAVQMLRAKGVVGKFVEYFGPGLANLAIADRAILANMSPEYGATIGYFPVDGQTLDYLRLTGRPDEHVALIEAYMKEQGLFHTAGSPEPLFSDVLELDLSKVEPSISGPRRPQDRVPLRTARQAYRQELIKEIVDDQSRINQGVIERWLAEGGNPANAAAQPIPASELGHIGHRVKAHADEQDVEIGHGAVLIAAITSCTNTSNPSVMLGAGILAKKAVERGLQTKPWVKTSLAPGSKVVTQYLKRAGLLPYLEQLRYNLAGYGCTTCIGNSGPVAEGLAAAVAQNNLVACAVLSGNRNFEGRINPVIRFNYLASPPLVVAYAIAGSLDWDPDSQPLGIGKDGKAVYLKDIWPSAQEIREAVASSVDSAMFREEYARVYDGDERWQGLPVPKGEVFAWQGASTYVKEPPFFQGITLKPAPLGDIRGGRVLVMLGNSVTTDHISPAGTIELRGPAGEYLMEHGVQQREFNTYGSRRGNHDVLARGTFANIRLRNKLVPGVEGGYSVHLPDGTRDTIFEVSRRYIEEGVPLLLIAGKEYGSGSSRDWAAKGPKLLGVKAVIAESYERIHRSNLVQMGVLPLQFMAGENAETLGLTGKESYSIEGITAGLKAGQQLTVIAEGDGKKTQFKVLSRIDTPVEVDYVNHGGILPYVLRELIA